MQAVLGKPKKLASVTRRHIAWMLSQGKEPELIRLAIEMAPCEESEKQRILQELHMEEFA